MEFSAKINSRSSSKKGGPPGEREIIKLNPQRSKNILQCTGWEGLEDGTLNLEVEKNIVHELLKKKTSLIEPGDQVNYPERYAHIPLKRKAYLYFLGTITFNDITSEVLFRTAKNPIWSRIEAFSAVHLRTKLNLSDGDSVLCSIMVK